jgi:hypothetical protein
MNAMRHLLSACLLVPLSTAQADPSESLLPQLRLQGACNVRTPGSATLTARIVNQGPIAVDVDIGEVSAHIEARCHTTWNLPSAVRRAHVRPCIYCASFSMAGARQSR